MERHVLSTLLWMLIVVQKTTGSPHLAVSPSVISPSLTSSLTVNCTFDHGSLSNLSNIISLTLSKSDQNNSPPKFVEIVSLHIFDSGHVHELLNVNATTSGHVDAKSQSFLSLVWANPKDTESGLYRCDIRGVDDDGRCVDLSASSRVTLSKADLDQLLSKLVEIQMELVRQEKTQSKATSTLKAKFEEQVQYQTLVITELKSQLDRQAQKSSEMTAALFEKSVVHNGSYYLLSKQYGRNMDVMEAICEQHGGHLAEIDDSSEHDFIKDFLNQFRGRVANVFLGATDEISEGTWKFRFSGKPMEYTEWQPGQPDTQGLDCVQLFSGYDWKMSAYPCYDHDHPKENFLCEVPV